MEISHFSKHIFWSYNQQADLPEELVIRQVSIYGDIPDIKKLIELVNKEQIISVLEKIKKKYDKRVNFIMKVML